MALLIKMLQSAVVLDRNRCVFSNRLNSSRLSHWLQK